LDDNKRLKKELLATKKELKEAQVLIDRLRKLLGGDAIGNWKPQERIEAQYSWLYAWLYPLYSFMNTAGVSPDIRKKIHEIVYAIISQLAVYGKYGIRLPFDPQPVDTEHIITKQENYRQLNYEPCIICGEDRITHDCHIIPMVDGGPNNRKNYITLCPLHHHLFDNNRLFENEWEQLEKSINDKSEVAIIYLKEVRFPLMRSFWKKAN